MPTQRIPFVGEAYKARSVAAAAQTCINLFPERIEDPQERDKGGATLYGDPGYHLAKDLSTIDAGFTAMRGVWSGGGRLFVAGGTKYCELNSSYNLVGSVRTISNSAVNGMSNPPVQFFPNGNALMIVSGGVAYIDDGTGPVLVQFDGYAGTVDTFAVGGILFYAQWVSGDKFSPDMVGQTITINGSPYTVIAYYYDEQIGLATSAGTQSGVAYSMSAPGVDCMTGGYIDGYYVIGRTNSKNYNIGALNNSTGPFWNALDFSSKNTYPDYLRAVLAKDDLFLFGVESTDVHRNTGGSPTSDFPFQKMDGASFGIGTASPWSPIKIDDRVFFLGVNSQGRVSAYTLDGYTPRRISNHAEEYQWSAANLGANCVSYSEQYEGHWFWVINFGSQTWVYDLTEDVWHSRNFQSGGSFTTFPFQYHTYIPEFGNGRHIVCGGFDSKIYEASLDFYDDIGVDRMWERTLPHFYAGGRQQFFGRMTLDLQTGTAATGTPVVTRYWSDDRGETFSNPETASIGSLGNNTIRVFWPGTSMSRDRVYRIRGTGQYRVALNCIDMEYRIGRA